MPEARSCNLRNTGMFAYSGVEGQDSELASALTRLGGEL